MVGEHEHRGAEYRVIAPPALPVLVGPRAALRPELVPPHDLGTDSGAPIAGEGVVGAGASPWRALHLVEGARAKQPLHEPATGVTERCLEALPLAGGEAVERHRQVVDANA